MAELNNIRKAISDHFGMVVSVGKLKEPKGSKTVARAKSIGVYIAREGGHSNADRAKTFGYQNEKYVSNVYSRVSRDINTDRKLKQTIDKVSEELSL